MTWELPPGWRWRPIAECLTRVGDQVRPEAIPGGALYLGLEHLRSGTGEYGGIEAGSAGIRSHKLLFRTGDVLYGKLRPNLRKCVVAESPGVCSTDLVPLRPMDPDEAHFLALQLRSEQFTATVVRLVSGANLPRVSVPDLLALSLPTPPESERERLNELARSVVRLRARQRELELSVTAVDRAATASVLGLDEGRGGRAQGVSARPAGSRSPDPGVGLTSG